MDRVTEKEIELHSQRWKQSEKTEARKAKQPF